MRRILVAAIIMAASQPAFAQSSTATGTGVASSKATSAAGAVAIGGGNATGGSATGGSVTIAPSPAATTSTSNQTVRQSGGISNVPAVFAPGLTAAALETCMGSVSAGVSWLGTGLTGGGTYVDPSCTARLDARQLWSMGLRKAALIRLCQMTDIYNSMPEVCVQYMPARVQPTPAGYNAYASTSQIELIDGKTGKVRLCDKYDAPKQRCRVWARN